MEKKIVKITESQYKDITLNEKLTQNVFCNTSLLYPRQFGNPIQENLINLYRGKVNEGYYKTYPLQNVVNYISSMLGNNGKAYVQQLGEHAVINVVVKNNYEIIEQLEKAFGLCGYYKSLMEELKDNIGFVNIQFEPRYSNNVDEIVNQIGYLYHITTEKHLKKIMTNGLSPRSTNTIFKYPPRVYCLLGNASNNIIFNTIDTLAHGITQKNGQEFNNNLSNIEQVWCILGIDVSVLPQDIQFYADTTMFDGTAIFTYDNIPPNAIRLLKKVQLN